MKIMIKNYMVGVPLTFVEKFCCEQFEIIGADESNGIGLSNGVFDGGKNRHCYINGKRIYKQIFIRKVNK